MIDPLRYRSLEEQLEFDEDNSPMQCKQCLRGGVSTPAFFLCHECGNTGDPRPFCEPCFFDYHLTKRKGKEGHKPHPIVQGDPVTVQTLADGDGVTFAKMHDWVTLDYILTTDESDVAVEDTFLAKQPLTFQSGCSGPCIHLQLRGCTGIAAADIMGASDPYCAVYWKNNFVGATTTKHMTLNPKWANQTFVLPLAAESLAALDGGEGSSAFFNAGALSPKLRIELYDWDRLSKNDFLGQVSLSDAEILPILRQIRSGETDENQAISFDLRPKQSRGQLGIRVALLGSKLYVHIMEAENVPKADPFSLSDPYCEVFWNDELVGKTAHINNTLDPVWDLEIFAFKVDKDGPNSVEKSTLRVVCLDWDQFGSDDVLGQIELTGPQIKQLVESKDGDEGADAGEQAMGEADMEKIFEFVQMFQENEIDEARLGKMIVGVPQDPSIKSQQHDAKAVDEDVEVVETTSNKKKRRHKKQKKGGAPEAEEHSQRRLREGQGAAENTEVEESRAQVLSLGAEAGRRKDEPQTNVGEQKSRRAEAMGNQEGARAVEEAAATKTAAVEAAVLEDGMDDEDCAKEGGRQGEEHHEEPKQNEELERLPLRESRRVDGGVVPGESRNEECRDADVSGGEDNPASHDTKASFDALNVENLAEKTGARTENDSTLDAGGLLPGPDHTVSVAPGGDAETSGVSTNIATTITVGVTNAAGHETDVGNSTGSEGLTPGEPRERKTILESKTNEEDQSAKEDVAADHAPKETANDGVEEGGGRAEEASPKAEPRASRKWKKTTRDSFRYLDASVQRFEEGRGVLVEYLNDGKSVWLETKVIPRLQIRADTPVAHNILERIWGQRHRLLSLHKRVLNVKRGMKALMGVAMTGSRMQWYQLGLTDEQSGANFVRGTVDCRFLYHTRGSVLRGLDVAVSHMSLGERARVEVRSDYGFGEVYASRCVPPYVTLVFVVQVAAIGHRSAKWLLVRRALRDRMDDALFRLRSRLSSVASSYGAARRLAALLRSLRREGKSVKALVPDDEESAVGDPGLLSERTGYQDTHA
ncbi:unnamed protein product [Ectocarpus sp. CCAP 1310/34]|nr:unnamed protein product [Ectocarpus sp. CCAP 1310/34]